MYTYVLYYQRISSGRNLFWKCSSNHSLKLQPLWRKPQRNPVTLNFDLRPFGGWLDKNHQNGWSFHGDLYTILELTCKKSPTKQTRKWRLPCHHGHLFSTLPVQKQTKKLLRADFKPKIHMAGSSCITPILQPWCCCSCFWVVFSVMKVL